MPPKKGNTAKETPHASNQPIPTSINQKARRHLFPYLALGFTPVKTSGEGLLCGINALYISYCNAREFLRAAGDPAIQHPTEQQFRNLRASHEYQGAVAEYEVYIQTLGLASDKEYQEMIDEAREFKHLNSNNLHNLLKAANSTWGTNFELGIITQGFRCIQRNQKSGMDEEVVQPTTAQYIGDGTSDRPVIWLYNDNAEVAAERRGQERIGHWEGFGPPGSGNVHQDVVRHWNLGGPMRAQIARGVWRVRAQQDGRNDRLPVQVGAFVYKTRRLPPKGVKVPPGWHYMATADGQHTGLVPDSILVKIELHESAPEAVEGGAPPEDSDGATRGSLIILQSQVNLRPFLGSVGNITIFRVVTPTNRKGARLTPAQLLSFTRENFRLTNGEFLLDLGDRHGHWFRVRKVNGVSGWAHERRLQKLENPWNLPTLVNFKTVFSPLNDAWDVDKISVETRRRGLVTSEDREHNLEAIRAWDAARQETLPLKTFVKGRGRAIVWSDGSKILDHELVLERKIRNFEEHLAPQVVDKDPLPEAMEKFLTPGAAEKDSGPENVELNLAPVIVEEDAVSVGTRNSGHGITSFDCERAWVQPKNLDSIPKGAWGLRMTDAERQWLMDRVIAAEPLPREGAREAEAPNEGSSKKPSVDENSEVPPKPTKRKSRTKPTKKPTSQVQKGKGKRKTEDEDSEESVPKTKKQRPYVKQDRGKGREKDKEDDYQGPTTRTRSKTA